MKKITPEIYIENCQEALEFYQETFGGEVKNIQKADGVDGFEGHAGKIIHSELHIKDTCVIYLVDMFDKKQGSNIHLVLELDSKKEIDNLYSILSQEGDVNLELQKTFWGAYHAVVNDKFGVTWALNYMEKG